MSDNSIAREAILRLLSPDERIAMNLFELILESENLCLHTDRKSCILLQSNPQTPLWAWLRRPWMRRASNPRRSSCPSASA